MSSNLRAGEFFGDVPRKLATTLTVMTEVVHACRRSVPRHSHELGHFQLLLSGSYRETIGERTTAPAPMTIAWHRPGLTHRDEIGNGGSRFFMVELKPTAVTRFEEFARLPADFHIRGNELVRLAGRLYSEFQNWDACSELIAEGVSLEMLAFLARTSIGYEKRPPLWLRRVVDRLNSDYLTNPSSEELAATAGVHPVHLAAMFRQFFHQTIGEYVQALRVQHATRLLGDHDLSLADIAIASGFSDQSHLTRTFKRRIGTTPGVYRDTLY